MDKSINFFPLYRTPNTEESTTKFVYFIDPKSSAENGSQSGSIPQRNSTSDDVFSLDTSSSSGFKGMVKAKLNNTKRRLSISQAASEKSVVIIVVLLTVVFVISKVPMGISAILDDVPGLENEIHFQNFKHMSNVLELFNASFNFYVYCLCHKEIRLHVWNFMVTTMKKLKTATRCLVETFLKL